MEARRRKRRGEERRRNTEKILKLTINFVESYPRMLAHPHERYQATVFNFSS